MTRRRRRDQRFFAQPGDASVVEVAREENMNPRRLAQNLKLNLRSWGNRQCDRRQRL
jgi:hypothetical protein